MKWHQLEELDRLTAALPAGEWTYIGDTIVGVVRECKCPPEELLNENAGEGYYVVAEPPHEAHDVLPARRRSYGSERYRPQRRET